LIQSTDNSFGKKHKLCNKILLDALFEKGTAFFSYPFRCVYLITDREEDSENVQIVVTVSKRNHKRAVSRNLIKRRIRESYRINKTLWLKKEDGQFIVPGKRLLIAFIYTSKDILDYKTIENGVRRGIVTACKNIEKNPDFSAGSGD